MLCEWVWMLVSACVCVSFLLRSARPEISLSITNDEWPEKWTYEFVKWQHPHTRTSRTGCMDILIVCHRRKHFVYIYMFIYCMSHKWLLRMWYGCYHNSHTTTSSTKSSIILYYLLGPSSSCRHTTPFRIIHIVIVLRFDLHLIKFMINNSIANQHTHTYQSTYSKPLTLTARRFSSRSHFESAFCIVVSVAILSTIVFQIDWIETISRAIDWPFELNQFYPKYFTFNIKLKLFCLCFLSMFISNATNVSWIITFKLKNL